jgi:hypothetical protein
MPPIEVFKILLSFSLTGCDGTLKQPLTPCSLIKDSMRGKRAAPVASVKHLRSSSVPCSLAELI